MNKFFNYLQTISRANGLGNGQEVQWLFHCGMLFSSGQKWWGDFKLRSTAHEGIDITYFRTHSNEVQCFDSSIKIPAMDDGMIINICDDFLGQTLVIEHKNSKALACRILFAYSHIIPEKDVNIDLAIKKEDIIATVCDTRKNPQLPPHLHFSCFEVSKQVLPRHLNWNLFSNCRELNVIHPCFL